MVDEIYTVIPWKQVIAQRLRENANQYYKKKKICCKIKKVSCYMKCVLKVLKVYFHGSIKHLQDYQEVYLKKNNKWFHFNLLRWELEI